MNENFKECELLLRAVYPENKKPDFWKNGRLSSAALKDKRGLSVTRTYDRALVDSINWMKQNFQGSIISISVSDCCLVKASIKYRPSKSNKYHSEIHKNETEVELSDEQALVLSRKAKIVFEPIVQYAV